MMGLRSSARALSCLLVAGVAVICGAVGSAQHGPPAPVAIPKALEAGARTTSVVGSAWHADNRPLAQARVRLRSMASGRIKAVAVANDEGRFLFRAVDSGSYAVELVAEDGAVLTVGQTFTVAAGETVATFVRLGSKVPWFDGFFSNAAAAIASSAAAAGVTALAPERVRPVSARR